MFAWSFPENLTTAGAEIWPEVSFVAWLQVLLFSVFVRRQVPSHITGSLFVVFLSAID